MSTPYTGQERRKSTQIEILTKRVLNLELQASRQQELTELALGHLKTEQRKLTKDFEDVKSVCRGCAGFGDDYK